MSNGSPGHYVPNQSGDVVCLQAGNGLYLSRVNRGDRNPIEAAKSNVDEFSRFKFTLVGAYKFTLQADNGLYLSRVNRGNTDPIEAAKSSVDVFSTFTVYEFVNGRIAIIADNGKFLSPFDRDGTYPIEAANRTAYEPGSVFGIERLYEE